MVLLNNTEDDETKKKIAIENNEPWKNNENDREQ
jgi:hypothetical protein